MRGTISNVFLRLERQTTTFKDRLSLFLMIFKINIIKISVYTRHTYMGYLGLYINVSKRFVLGAILPILYQI